MVRKISNTQQIFVNRKHGKENTPHIKNFHYTRRRTLIFFTSSKPSLVQKRLIGLRIYVRLYKKILSTAYRLLVHFQQGFAACFSVDF